jgi:hypothetical protein
MASICPSANGGQLLSTAANQTVENILCKCGDWPCIIRRQLANFSEAAKLQEWFNFESLFKSHRRDVLVFLSIASPTKKIDGHTIKNCVYNYIYGLKFNTLKFGAIHARHIIVSDKEL